MRKSEFKTYQRGRRQASIDTLFTNGMMFTNGTVDEGYLKTLVNYDITKEGDTLVPRAGLRLSDLVVADYVYEDEFENKQYHTDSEITLMAAKECIEEGTTYKQFILGKPGAEDQPGQMWVCTSTDTGASITSDVYDSTSFNFGVHLGRAVYEGVPCAFMTTPLTAIHKMPMAPESKVASIVGDFAFGNSFYFLNPESGIQYTKLDPDAKIKKYTIHAVEPKELDPSEAVTFGYNMLAGESAYSFINEPLSGVIQLTGLLPYSAKKKDVLLLTPHHNEDVTLRCYFKAQVDKEYKFIWEWRNVGDDTWHELQTLDQSPTYKIGVVDDKAVLKVGDEILENLEITFKAPTEDILVRVQAYNVEDLENVEKAMTMGFNFSNESYGATSNLQQEVYDLKTAKGMTCWRNRLVLWGVPKDPTVLFLSDINDPSYFPYPNNISIFDEPIVYVKEFLDSLLVFTTNSIYQLTLNNGGTSWTSTLVQSDLNISPWDRHLIQIVRNMVFFKSGDYYYMLVPKAQSITGKLTLAPVSNSIIEFFNYFETNMTKLLEDAFDYTGLFTLVNYFNYLDYEDVHNVYVIHFDDERVNKSGYLHFDLLYNTVTRAWRVHTFESPHYLFPYKQDATKRGVLASTSVLNLASRYDETVSIPSRCIQLFSYDSLNPQDMYIPDATTLKHSLVADQGIVSYDIEYMQEALREVILNVSDRYYFHNWQFLDTGYRDDVLERNKRYRELQFQLNNIDGASLEFGLEFQIDGQVRMTYYDYVIEHVVDEHDPNYGLLYVQASPKMNLPVEGDDIPNETRLGDSNNSWVLEQSLFPEISLWKVRTPVSGKGAAPRVRLISRNAHRYELMNINWIYRIMNMR